jgi:hypothetical protein
MNIKVRELLKQVERMELAAKHGLDIPGSCSGNTGRENYLSRAV